MTKPLFLPKNAQNRAKSNPIFHLKGRRDTALILWFLDSPMVNFILKNIYFVQFWPPSWGKWAPKLDKNWKKKTLVTCSFCKNWNFQKNFNTLFLSLTATSGASLTKIEPFLGELGPKTPRPKWPNSWMLHRTKNFWKFITWELQMLWRWNLPRLCIFIRPSIWQNIWTSPIGSGRAWPKNLWKKPQKLFFWGSISWNFQ